MNIKQAKDYVCNEAYHEFIALGQDDSEARFNAHRKTKRHFLNPTDEIFRDKWMVAIGEHEYEPEIGDIVKINNGREAFWVIITDLNKKWIIGKVDNLLVREYKYDLGSFVKFKINHITDLSRN